MKLTPNDYRREASLVEEIAEAVSLLPDKQELLAEARLLRRRATEIEDRAAVAEQGSEGAKVSTRVET